MPSTRIWESTSTTPVERQVEIKSLYCVCVCVWVCMGIFYWGGGAVLQSVANNRLTWATRLWSSARTSRSSTTRGRSPTRWTDSSTRTTTCSSRISSGSFTAGRWWGWPSGVTIGGDHRGWWPPDRWHAVLSDVSIIIDHRLVSANDHALDYDVKLSIIKRN